MSFMIERASAQFVLESGIMHTSGAPGTDNKWLVDVLNPWRTDGPQVRSTVSRICVPSEIWRTIRTLNSK